VYSFSLKAADSDDPHLKSDHGAFSIKKKKKSNNTVSLKARDTTKGYKRKSNRSTKTKERERREGGGCGLRIE
jgi:hypothetical protein